MKKFGILVLTAMVFSSLQASWYWPFGSDEPEEKPKRISELVEPASRLIDEASDLAAEGKVSDSVAKYREALDALNQIEAENPERAKTSEFATIRNKRAYVSAAIDSMLLSQVKENAKAVAVSDTTELEKRLAAEKQGKKYPEKSASKPSPDTQSSTTNQPINQVSAQPPSPAPNTQHPTANTQSQSPREQVMVAISKSDWPTAERLIGKMLESNPNGMTALNLKAAMEMQQGKFKEAEATLDQAIQSHPRSYFAYYNMARLLLQVRKDDTAAAKRYYQTGRTFGGPVDARLEDVLK